MTKDKEEVERILDTITEFKDFNDREEVKYMIQSFVEQEIYVYYTDEKGKLYLKKGKNFDKRNELPEPTHVAGKKIEWVEK